MRMATRTLDMVLIASTGEVRRTKVQATRQHLEAVVGSPLCIRPFMKRYVLLSNCPEPSRALFVKALETTGCRNPVLIARQDKDGLAGLGKEEALSLLALLRTPEYESA